MGKVTIEENLFGKAIQGDSEAIKTMFFQFIGTEDAILSAQYFGSHGFIFKTHSFACYTDKKIVSLTVASFNEIVYQDASIEDLNSGVIYQPSLFMLYLLSTILILGTCGVGILLLPLITKWFYKIKKSGLVWNIKDGISVYVFANRNKINNVNKMWREVAQLRESRLKYLK